ncbi:MAG: Efflux ABC transporter, ATP-binding protein, partial [uncultured Acidimicrobiales bacterium]
ARARRTHEALWRRGRPRRPLDDGCPRAHPWLRRSERRRQDHHDADRPRPGPARRGGGALEGPARDRRRPPGLRLHAGGAGAVPEDDRPRPDRLLRPPVGHGAGGGIDCRPGDPRVDRHRRAQRGAGGAAVARQPAAVPAGCCSCHVAGAPRARRAVQRPRSRGRRRPVRGAADPGRSGDGGGVLQPPARTGGTAERRGHDHRPGPGGGVRGGADGAQQPGRGPAQGGAGRRGDGVGGRPHRGQGGRARRQRGRAGAASGGRRPGRARRRPPRRPGPLLPAGGADADRAVPGGGLVV